MVKATKPEPITINSVGPNRHVQIPLVPGVTVLSGRNGAGKSEALKSIAGLMGGERKQKPTHGAETGTVTGPGLRMRVGTTRTSKPSVEDPQLVLDSVDGHDALNDLIEPGFKSEEANNKAMIAAILRIAGVQPDVMAFSDAIDPTLLMELNVKKSGTIVDMAGEIKRACDSKALDAEKLAAEFTGEIKGLHDATPEMGTEPVADGVGREALLASLEDAVSHKAALQARYDTWAEAGKQAVAAQQEYGLLQSEYENVRSSEHWQTEIQRLQVELEMATVKLAESKNIETGIDRLAKVLDAANADDAPTDDDIKSATMGVDGARSRLELFERQAEYSAAREKITDLEARRDKQVAKGKSLRKAAKASHGVLSGLLSGCSRFEVNDAGKVVIDDKAYLTMSPGERTIRAIELQVSNLDGPKVFVFPQHLWEALDGPNRKLVREYTEEKGVYFITAQASQFVRCECGERSAIGVLECPECSAALPSGNEVIVESPK